MRHAKTNELDGVVFRIPSLMQRSKKIIKKKLFTLKSMRKKYIRYEHVVA